MTDIRETRQDVNVKQNSGGNIRYEKPKAQATYKFEYAMKRLRDAIDYAEMTNDFQQARLWANHVEAAYNADIEAEQELTANANEGAKLLHSLAMHNYDTTVDHPIPADLLDIARWQDEVEATRKSDYPR